MRVAVVVVCLDLGLWLWLAFSFNFEYLRLNPYIFFLLIKIIGDRPTQLAYCRSSVDSDVNPNLYFDQG